MVYGQARSDYGPERSAGRAAYVNHFALEKQQNDARVVFRWGQELRPKVAKKTVRVSVTLDEAAYAELVRLAVELNLSAAWMIRRSVSEFIAKHSADAESALPLSQRTRRAAAKKKIGGLV